jgi:hypothetical protein
VKGSTKRGNKKLKICTIKKGTFKEVDGAALDDAVPTD